MMVFKSEPSGFADIMRPPLRSRKKSLPAGAFFALLPMVVEAIALMERTSSLTFLSVLETGILTQCGRPTELLLDVRNTVISNLERYDVRCQIANRQAAHLHSP